MHQIKESDAMKYINTLMDGVRKDNTLWWQSSDHNTVAVTFYHATRQLWVERSEPLILPITPPHNGAMVHRLV